MGMALILRDNVSQFTLSRYFSKIGMALILLDNVYQSTLSKFCLIVVFIFVVVCVLNYDYLVEKKRKEKKRKEKKRKEKNRQLIN